MSYIFIIFEFNYEKVSNQIANSDGSKILKGDILQTTMIKQLNTHKQMHILHHFNFSFH
jgi:hypothetical protein